MRAKVSCYCINLRRAAGAVSALYDAKLSSLGITVNQYSLLCKIEQSEECSVSELAELSGLERTSVVRMLRPLEQRGYIADAAAPGERNRRLQLTAAGLQAQEAGYALWEEAQQEMEDRLGKEEMAGLMDTLYQLEEIAHA